MNKVYDKVEWDFLEVTMLKMGFTCSWVDLVMRCVSSVELLVLINGCPGYNFRPIHGLRQGDPFSPYHVPNKQRNVVQAILTSD